MSEGIAVYGSFVVYLTDGTTEERSGRFEFSGKGKDLYKAVRLVFTRGLVPRKRFTVVAAEKFLENPENYGMEGEWVEREVESL